MSKFHEMREKLNSKSILNPLNPIKENKHERQPSNFSIPSARQTRQNYQKNSKEKTNDYINEFDEIQYNKISLFNEENMNQTIKNLRNSTNKKNKFLKNYEEIKFLNENKYILNNYNYNNYNNFNSNNSSNQDSLDQIYDSSFLTIKKNNLNGQRFLTALDSNSQGNPNINISEIGRKFASPKHKSINEKILNSSSRRARESIRNTRKKRGNNSFDSKFSKFETNKIDNSINIQNNKESIYYSNILEKKRFHSMKKIIKINTKNSTGSDNSENNTNNSNNNNRESIHLKREEIFPKLQESYYINTDVKPRYRNKNSSIFSSNSKSLSKKEKENSKKRKNSFNENDFKMQEKEILKKLDIDFSDNKIPMENQQNEYDIKFNTEQKNIENSTLGNNEYSEMYLNKDEVYNNLNTDQGKKDTESKINLLKNIEINLNLKKMNNSDNILNDKINNNEEKFEDLFNNKKIKKLRNNKSLNSLNYQGDNYDNNNRDLSKSKLNISEREQKNNTNRSNLKNSKEKDKENNNEKDRNILINENYENKKNLNNNINDLNKTKNLKNNNNSELNKTKTDKEKSKSKEKNEKNKKNKKNLNINIKLNPIKNKTAKNNNNKENTLNFFGDSEDFNTSNYPQMRIFERIMLMSKGQLDEKYSDEVENIFGKIFTKNLENILELKKYPFHVTEAKDKVNIHDERNEFSKKTHIREEVAELMEKVYFLKGTLDYIFPQFLKDKLQESIKARQAKNNNSTIGTKFYSNFNNSNNTLNNPNFTNNRYSVNNVNNLNSLGRNNKYPDKFNNFNNFKNDKFIENETFNFNFNNIHNNTNNNSEYSFNRNTFKYNNSKLSYDNYSNSIRNSQQTKNSELFPMVPPMVNRTFADRSNLIGKSVDSKDFMNFNNTKKNYDFANVTKVKLISNETNPSLFNKFKNYRNITNTEKENYTTSESMVYKGAMYRSSLKFRNQQKKNQKLQSTIYIKNFNY